MAAKSLEVYYHNQHVGTLAEMPDKRIAFQYSSEWQKTGFPINTYITQSQRNSKPQKSYST